jgi:SnoaL-like protein
MRGRAVASAALMIAVGITVSARAQSPAPQPTVSPADRAAIEQLLAQYNQALSTCAAEQYASLFTPDGTFTSDDFRGARHRQLYGKSATIAGREKLVELVETEEFCLDPKQRAARTGANAGNRASFTNLALEPAVNGVRGVLPLANNGRYEDLYVKTADGWKFKSRIVVMPAAVSSK